ncbi:hypothetical protein QR680_012651 [Steinernema hermaphroditum]|nr:hypothetical protein QR680_012651 [Steinernema hermaphroditum]
MYVPQFSRTLNVGSDGNCGFRVLSLFLFGDESEHAMLRAAICGHIADQGEKWMASLTVLDKDPKAYLRRKNMHELKSWMGTVELQAAAELLNIHVLVYEPSCSGSWKWRKHSPDYTKLGFRAHIDNTLTDGRPVVAYYLSGNHFRLIVP